jgi:hypothetical protein
LNAILLSLECILNDLDGVNSFNVGVGIRLAIAVVRKRLNQK